MVPSLGCIHVSQEQLTNHETGCRVKVPISSRSSVKITLRKLRMINLCLGYKMAHLRTVATGYITWISIGLLSERFYMMLSMMIYIWLQTVYDKWKSQ